MPADHAAYNRCVVRSGKLAYIGLGANLGDRLGSFQRAVELLAASDKASAFRASRVYESPPWGFTSSHPFLNAVVELRWAGTPEELREECARIEAALGRLPRPVLGVSIEAGPYADRVIDLDVLWIEAVSCNTEQLTLPHPFAHLRAFVLLLLVELAPRLELKGCVVQDWLAMIDRAEVEATRPLAEQVLAVPGPG